MQGFLLSLFLTFYGTFLFPGILCQQRDGFEAFLHNAANEFPAWIAENGLDPTPESPFELNMKHSESLINITKLRIWNEVGTGYSRSVTADIYGDLLKAQFTVFVYLTSAFNVTAEYEVEGSVLSSVPVTGTGKVITEKPSSISYTAYIVLSVKGFEITPDGHIKMSAGDVSSRFEMSSPYNPSFEDLSAGGFEVEVSKILGDMYSTWSMNQVAEYLRSYFEALFIETPLSEIIGSTYPPPSTSTPPPESTTPISTTSEAPCPASAFQQNGFTFLEGNVIDKNVTVNEKGEMEEFVTKRVVFKRKL